MLAGPGDEPLPQGVTAAPAGARQLRWESPVLTLVEELVRRRADRHPLGEQVAEGPRLVAVGVAADRQVEGQHGPAGTLDRGQLPVGEVLGQEVAALDERGRVAGVGGVGRAGPEPGVVDDVRTRGDEAVDAGLDVRIEIAGRGEELAPAPAGERLPVDEVAERRASGPPGTEASSR